jgi:ribosomal subunit interface protein
MDLVVKGRGTKVTDHLRHVIERKLERLTRHEPRVQRVEVEVIEEPNPRVDGGHRVEATCWTNRVTFHATARGRNMDGLVDRVVHRLERQISDHHSKRRRRLIDGANKLKSAQLGSAVPSASDLDGDLTTSEE